MQETSVAQHTFVQHFAYRKIHSKYLENNHQVVLINCILLLNGWTTQEWYPKKNWSSLMLINCEHPSVVANLTLENANTQTAKWLHRMEWCNEDAGEIGELPRAYNYLVDYYHDGEIKALHFTDGGPWHPGYEDVQFADRWLAYIGTCLTTW